MNPYTAYAAILLASAAVASTAAIPEDVLIHSNAQDVQRHSYPESKSQEIAFRVPLDYPRTAVTEGDYRKLADRGWSKCSGYHEGWDKYVDASSGKGNEHTVFQNVSYWSKGDTLMGIIERYYAGVSATGGRLDSPDNMDQRVVITLDQNADMRNLLNLSCP